MYGGMANEKKFNLIKHQITKKIMTFDFDPIGCMIGPAVKAPFQHRFYCFGGTPRIYEQFVTQLSSLALRGEALTYLFYGL